MAPRPEPLLFTEPRGRNLGHVEPLGVEAPHERRRRVRQEDVDAARS